MRYTISDAQVDALFQRSLERALAAARLLIPEFNTLSDARQVALVDMAFDLGRTKLAELVAKIETITASSFLHGVAGELVHTDYYKQGGDRAGRNYGAIVSDQLPPNGLAPHPKPIDAKPAKESKEGKDELERKEDKEEKEDKDGLEGKCGKEDKDKPALPDFDDTGEHRDRALIEFSMRFLGHQLLVGRFTTYARAMGGGEPIRLGAEVWELDDFTHRFSTCAIDPRRPFDPAATLTHRIFVDEADVQAIYDACCAEVGPPPKHHRAPAHSAAQGSPDDHLHREPAFDDIALERLLRLPEIESLVGLSRSTIYDRIAKGRFPEQVKNGSRIASWREGDVRAWLADPR